MENASNSTMKTRSIRADETVLERFRALSEEYPNQSEALSALIKAWELQNAKAVLSGMETDITDFTTHLQAIESAFLHVLDINNNTEQRIRDEFCQLLSSKDNQIIDLQHRLSETEQRTLVAEQAVEQAQAQARAAEQAAQEQTAKAEQRATIAAEQAEKAERLQLTVEQAAADKQTVIDNLRDQLEEAKATKQRVKAAEQATAEAQARVAELQQQLTDAKNAAEIERAKAAAEQAKAVAEVEKALNMEIKQLMTENKELILQLTSKRESDSHLTNTEKGV